MWVHLQVIGQDTVSYDKKQCKYFVKISGKKSSQQSAGAWMTTRLGLYFRPSVNMA
jgi:hypothetical protein